MEKQILKALKKVFDPEVRLSVVDMGLIYNIRAKEDKVTILMTFTNPICPYGITLKNAVREAAKKVKGIKHVTVKLTLTPPWNPQKISKEARLQLGF